jgi:3D (Asp-Asp-Asp) domain-containing protein
MNMLPLGSHIRILTGPLAGYVATVLDRIGWGTDLDVWMASCWEARQYGKQVVQIQVG